VMLRVARIPHAGETACRFSGAGQPAIYILLRWNHNVFRTKRMHADRWRKRRRRVGIVWPRSAVHVVDVVLRPSLAAVASARSPDTAHVPQMIRYHHFTLQHSRLPTRALSTTIRLAKLTTCNTIFNHMCVFTVC